MATDPLERIGAFRKQQKAKEQRRKEMMGDNSSMSVSVIMTGAGQDGIVQPHLPTGTLSTVNGPAMVHEGETIRSNGNGSVDVIPYSPGDQQSLMNIDASPGGALETMGYQGGVNGVKTGYRGGGRMVSVGYANGGNDIMLGGAMDVMPSSDVAPAPASTTDPLALLDPVQSQPTSPFGPSGPGTTSFTPATNTADTISTAPSTTSQPTTVAPIGDYDPSQYLEQIATGQNPYIQGTVDRALGTTEDINRENIMMGAQQMAVNPNITGGAQNAMTTQLMSNAAAARSQAMTDAAADTNQMMYEANLKLLDEGYRQDALAKENYNLAQGALDRAREIQNQMLQSGYTNADVANSAEFKYQMDEFNRLTGKTPEFSDPLAGFDDFTQSFLTTGEQIGLQQNKAQFEDNAISLMQDMIENTGGQATWQDAVQNEDILRNAAAYLGDYDPYIEGLDPQAGELVDTDGDGIPDKTVKRSVVNWIEQTYGVKDRSDTQIAADYMMNEFVNDDPALSSNPNIEADLKDILQSAVSSGNVSVVDGQVQFSDTFSFPWDDVSGKKYGSYTTPYGDQITYDEQGNPSIGGVAFDEYQMKDSEGNVIDGVNYQDFLNSWGDLSIIEQNKYLDNKGEIDPDKINALVKYNPTSSHWYDAEGNAVVTSKNVNDYITYVDSDGVYDSEFVDRSGKGLGDVGYVPQGATLADDYGAIEGEGFFNYLGEDGTWHNMATNSKEFRDLWYQASLEYGEPVDSDRLAEWAEGKVFSNDGTTVYDPYSDGFSATDASPLGVASLLGFADQSVQGEVGDSNKHVVEQVPDFDQSSWDDFVSGLNIVPRSKMTAGELPVGSGMTTGVGTIYNLGQAKDSGDYWYYNADDGRFWRYDDRRVIGD